MIWFMFGLAVGGVLGIVVMALMVAAKQADERLESDNDMPAGCFWCGGRMAKMHDGVLVCSDCGWRYKGKESEVEEE
jgi:hypothetical protein